MRAQTLQNTNDVANTDSNHFTVAAVTEEGMLETLYVISAIFH